jgi:hypothetical protein
MDLVIYMSPIPHIPEQFQDRFGYMLSLSGKVFDPVSWWMLDNGEFTKKFKLEKWLEVLNDKKQFTSFCKGVVIPDELYDAGRTLDKFWKFVEYVPKEYPIAFVTQNGVTSKMIPWDNIDTLFIGGDDQHKLKDSFPLINEAHKRGKWVHIGRVNSPKRIKIFWMADSCDGTHFLKSSNLIRSCQNFLYACEFAKAKKQQRKLI